MLNIYTKTYSIKESVMENANRIIVPVKYLRDNGITLYSSEIINKYSSDLIAKYNSEGYIKKFAITANETACNFCTYINSIEEK